MGDDGVMIPDLDLARVQRWIDARNGEIRFDARDKIRYEVDVADRTITVLECRPPWREGFGTDWTRLPICRFRYTKVRKEWSLYWRDRNLKFHEYDLAEPTPHIDELIEEVKRNQPKVYRQGLESPGSVCPPGGESMQEAQSRIVKFVQKLVRKHRDEIIAIIAPDPLALLIHGLLSGEEPHSDLWTSETDAADWQLIEVELG